MNKFDTTNSYWLEPTCSCLKYRCCQSLGYVARDNTSDACIRVYMSAAGGGLPSKRLLGMCRWMGSHFHNWIDYKWVTFLVELLEWGRKFSGFLG